MQESNSPLGGVGSDLVHARRVRALCFDITDVRKDSEHGQQCIIPSRLDERINRNITKSVGKTVLCSGSSGVMPLFSRIRKRRCRRAYGRTGSSQVRTENKRAERGGGVRRAADHDRRVVCGLICRVCANRPPPALRRQLISAIHGHGVDGSTLHGEMLHQHNACGGP